MAPKAVLVGLPGSGKSTIGRRLAKALGVDLLDSDVAIEQKTGRSVADIFATDGEQEFRRVEEDVVRGALADHDGVLSLGGGAVTSAGVRAALAGHTVILLEVGVAEGVRRTGGHTVRPLLAGGDRDEKFRALMAQRAPLYRRVATIRVNTNRRNPGAVVRHIVARLEKSAPDGARQPGKPGIPRKTRELRASEKRGRPPWCRPSTQPAEPVQKRPAADEPTSPPATPATPAAMAARRPEESK